MQNQIKRQNQNCTTSAQKDCQTYFLSRKLLDINECFFFLLVLKNWVITETFFFILQNGQFRVLIFLVYGELFHLLRETLKLASQANEQLMPAHIPNHMQNHKVEKSYAKSTKDKKHIVRKMIEENNYIPKKFLPKAHLNDLDRSCFELFESIKLTSQGNEQLIPA